MKRIKKYNEIKTIPFSDMTTWGSTEAAKNEVLDVECIRDAFIDFIDKGASFDFDIDKEGRKGDEEDWCEVAIDCVVRGTERDIDEYIAALEEERKQLEDIKVSILKVKGEIEGVKVDFFVEETGENNAWVNTIERKIYVSFTL